MKKRLFLAVLFLVLFTVLFSSAVLAEGRVAIVFATGGLGDQSFNDAAWRGLEKAKEDILIKIQVVESSKMNDYGPNLKSLADQEYDMVWAIGFLMTRQML